MQSNEKCMKNNSHHAIVHHVVPHSKSFFISIAYKKANRFLVAVMNELIFNGHTQGHTHTHTNDYEMYHTELTTFLYAIH